VAIPAYVINQVRKKNFRREKIPGQMNTVCYSAKCPNRGECFEKKQMTFLILGDVCTRSCKFCAIKTGQPKAVKETEIQNILEAIAKYHLEYVVITSVTRDDLPDGGAGHFANIIKSIKHKYPTVKVEVLTPDFLGNTDLVDVVLQSEPYVFNHNLEMSERLFEEVRPEGSFKISLKIINYAKKHYPSIQIKTGIMVGLGESKAEVISVIKKAQENNADIMTIGQYLAPSRRHQTVQRYVSLEEFKEYEVYGETIGIKVVSGPLVRSSYNAAEVAE
jgi:lipoyl synthase